MIKNQKNYQKPIKIDAHFKYKCPNNDCGYDHWLSFNESKTKNYKIVCDCGQVFYPKQIAKIKISYQNTVHSQKSVVVDNTAQTKVPIKILNSCLGALIQYGFDKTEAKDLITKEYLKCNNSTIQPLQLIKQILKNLETNI